MKVLVVDDAAAVRARIAALCADVPAVVRVLQADGVQAAKAALSQELPQALVVDLHLGEESGYALLEHVRQRQLAVTVIVLTNDPSEAHRRRCAALGAQFFFDKSREFEALLPVLAELAR